MSLSAAEVLVTSFCLDFAFKGLAEELGMRKDEVFLVVVGLGPAKGEV